MAVRVVMGEGGFFQQCYPSPILVCGEAGDALSPKGRGRRHSRCVIVSAALFPPPAKRWGGSID